MQPTYLAIDLGASSGRVLAGRFESDRLRLEEVHRFANPVRKVANRLRWNTGHLFGEIKVGLQKAAAELDEIVGVGVDTWGVDYALLDGDGNLLEEPVCYRDPRTEGMMERVFARVPREEIFRKTGIQFLPLNTLYQMFAQRELGEWPPNAARLLMMPDLFHYWLTGVEAGEYTIASTTQLLNAETRTWDADLFARLDLPLAVMPELHQPGTELGTLGSALQKQLGLKRLRVVLPAAHDTASAVVGTPLREGWAYISSGTWSLVGIETAAPILTDAALQHNFTNEGGAFGTNRFLKNVMGLWILERCRQEWQARGELLPYPLLQAELRQRSAIDGLIYPDDLRFLNPESMLETVAAFLRETGQSTPDDQVTVSKVVLDSLALRYASVLRSVTAVTGTAVRGVHVVGGGSQNDYLNQATANATGLEVLAGPVEATALGNLLVQAIHDKRFHDLEEARYYVQRTASLRRYVPQTTALWEEAWQRYQELEKGHG